jgi:hypothetical protein
MTRTEQVAELYNQGKSYREIARALGIPNKGVGAYMREARKTEGRVKEREYQATPIDARLTAQGRCACGLLLPCHHPERSIWSGPSISAQLAEAGGFRGTLDLKRLRQRK